MKYDHLLPIAAERLHYDPATGIFTWNIATSYRTPAGSVAGSNSSKGYRKIKINGCGLAAHRIAWFITYGAVPDQIDHRNGCKADNRINNLRDADGHVNAQNKMTAYKGNISGLLGVTWHAASNKWQANIRLEGKQYYLGVFQDKFDAQAAYLLKKRELHQGCTI